MSPTLPLSGYTVLDISGSVATATCGKLFADFGARVVNIERPERGHPTRAYPPHKSGVPAPESSGLHALLSPHKESVALDLEDQAQRDALLTWMRTADVVLESEAPGTLDRLGIGFEELVKQAPHLLLCSLTWWGQTGPLSGLPANDASICCQIGQVRSIGPPEGPPLLPSGYPVQILGGATGFISMATHLVARCLQRPPQPEHVDVSLFEAALALTDYGLPAAVGQSQEPRLGLNRHHPHYPTSIFPTREGWLGVTALTSAQWRNFCDVVGLPELGRDPAYQTSLNRLQDADHIEQLLVPALKRRPAAEWFHEGQARRIPLALVPTVAELFDSEQLRAREAFREVTHPDLGALDVPAAPFRLRNAPARRDGPVARLGEHRRPRSAQRDGAVLGSRREVAAATPVPPPLRSPGDRPPLLQGIRVVDLTMGWAGPLASRHLADMGAEVIKVESRQHFDWWRGLQLTPPEMADLQFEKRVAFNIMNRNKLGITLDLAQPRGAELLKELAAISDVVVENYSAGVLPKLGLDEPVLRAVNPRLVMLSMPPFGAGGPWHSYRAYGSTAEQASGLPHLQGTATDPPVTLHLALGDPVAGVHAAAALLLAILHQQRTGEGQSVDLSQVESVTSLGLHGVASQALLNEPPPRIGSRHPTHAPQGVYPCMGDDEWLMLTVDSDAAWTALADLVGDPALARPSLDRASGRRVAHDRIDEHLARWTASRQRDALLDALRRADIIAAPVLAAAEVFAHPQLQARDFWQWLKREYVGWLPHPVAPHRVGEHPATIDHPAPTLGEHSCEVLSTLLGIDEAELDALERAGIVGTRPLPAG